MVVRFSHQELKSCAFVNHDVDFLFFLENPDSSDAVRIFFWGSSRNAVNNHIRYGQDFADAFLLPTPCTIASRYLMRRGAFSVFHCASAVLRYQGETMLQILLPRGKKSLIVAEPFLFAFFVPQKGNSVKQGLCRTRLEQEATVKVVMKPL